MTKDQTFDLKGRGQFIHALQGMKPHHAGISPSSFFLPFAVTRVLTATSCPMEFHQFPDSNVFRHNDGIYDTAFLWFHDS